VKLVAVNGKLKQVQWVTKWQSGRVTTVELNLAPILQGAHLLTRPSNVRVN
jgi:hypothetical protein